MILPPLIACVDIEGFAVASCDRDIPEIAPDPTDPTDWPDWTDNWHWESDEDTDPDDQAAADAALEELPALCGGSPDDTTYEPSPTEWAAACDLFRRGSPLRAGDGSIEDDRPLDRFSAAGLAAVHFALYGRSEPFHA